MDPYEKYDMIFNGAAPARVLTSSPGKYAGEDNGWVLSLIYPALIEFDKSVVKFPSIKRYPRRSVERPDTGSTASREPCTNVEPEKTADGHTHQWIGCLESH